MSGLTDFVTYNYGTLQLNMSIEDFAKIEHIRKLCGHYSLGAEEIDSNYKFNIESIQQCYRNVIEPLFLSCSINAQFAILTSCSDILQYCNWMDSIDQKYHYSLWLIAATCDHLLIVDAVNRGILTFEQAKPFIPNTFATDWESLSLFNTITQELFDIWLSSVSFNKYLIDKIREDYNWLPKEFKDQFDAKFNC